MNAKDPVMIIFNSMNNDFENSGNIIISVRSEDYTADISKIDLLTKNLENKDFIKSVQSVSIFRFHTIKIIFFILEIFFP